MDEIRVPSPVVFKGIPLAPDGIRLVEPPGWTPCRVREAYGSFWDGLTSFAETDPDFRERDLLALDLIGRFFGSCLDLAGIRCS